MWRKGNIISGNVTLKRKANWVQRYATIDANQAIFSYKNKKTDKLYKYQIHLNNAIVKTGMSNRQPYMIIQGETETH